MAEATLDQARSRIDHVVVLMLENRSFDHLFGYLELSGVPPLGVEHANPLDLSDPSLGTEPPSNNGSHLLRLDPPHSHVGAKQQMGVARGGRHPMNGFVEAYRLKKLNREHLPVIHWRNVRILAVFISPPIASTLGVLGWRLRFWEWSGFLHWAGPATAVLTMVATARPLAHAAGFPGWKVVAGVLAGGVMLGSAADGLVRFVRNPRWVAAPLLVGAAVVALALVERFAARDAKKRRPLVGEKAQQATQEARQIMWCMPPDQIAVLGTLAREFTTCARWFSSVPGATWPNRNFLHAGTSSQSVDIEVGLYEDRTLFEMLDDQRLLEGSSSTLTDPPWKIYRDGMPHVIVFEDLWEEHLKDRWRDLDDFQKDCQRGTLPTYSFIEPRHSDGHTNSLHPGNNEIPSDGSSDFARGERLVWEIYQALVDRKDDLFDRTLLVITFDEHGGFFDRESPPATRHPEAGSAVRHPVNFTRRIVSKFVEHKNSPFDFKRLGVRVPTIVISPLVESGVDTRDYDHTSVSATVRDLFAPDQQPLGARAKVANTFWHLASRSDPRSLPDVPEPDYPSLPSPEEAHPSRPIPTRPAREDDDFDHQLRTVAKKVDQRLTERGAPFAAMPEDASPTERVDARLRLWGQGGG